MAAGREEKRRIAYGESKDTRHQQCRRKKIGYTRATGGYMPQFGPVQIIPPIWVIKWQEPIYPFFEYSSEQNANENINFKNSLQICRLFYDNIRTDYYRYIFLEGILWKREGHKFKKMRASTCFKQINYCLNETTSEYDSETLCSSEIFPPLLLNVTLSRILKYKYPSILQLHQIYILFISSYPPIHDLKKSSSSHTFKMLYAVAIAVWKELQSSLSRSQEKLLSVTLSPYGTNFVSNVSKLTVHRDFIRHETIKSARWIWIIKEWAWMIRKHIILTFGHYNSFDMRRTK